MQTKVGYMQYYENEDGNKPIAVGIILGVALPIIAIVVLLAICVVRRHRKHKPSENYIPDVWKEEGQKEGEETELNHVSVKADMNGSIPDDKGSGIIQYKDNCKLLYIPSVCICCRFYYGYPTALLR